jgi:hypothetical protein
VNGNPVNYAYSLAAVVDSSSPKMPDLSKQAGLLSGLFPTPPKEGRKAEGEANAQGTTPKEDPKLRAAVQQIIDSLKPLEDEVVAARKVAELSDQAEPLAQYTDYKAAHAGLRFAKDSLAHFSGAPGHLLDPKLKETLQARADAAAQIVKSDDVFVAAVAGLRGYGDALRETSEQLRKSIGDASSRPEVCETVSKGTTTLTMKAAQKDSGVAKARVFAKEEVFTIVNQAPLERDRIATHPVALGVVAPGSSDFYVENGILRADKNKVNWRPGLIVDGLVGADASGEVGVSLGIGLATAFSDAPLSDVFASANIDFFNLIRVGLGVGASNVPAHVKNLTEGSPFPADKKLDDEIVRAWRPSLYLTFVLPGFSPGK